MRTYTRKPCPHAHGLQQLTHFYTNRAPLRRPKRRSQTQPGARDSSRAQSPPAHRAPLPRQPRSALRSRAAGRWRGTPRGTARPLRPRGSEPGRGRLGQTQPPRPRDGAERGDTRPQRPPARPSGLRSARTHLDVSGQRDGGAGQPQQEQEGEVPCGSHRCHHRRRPSATAAPAPPARRDGSRLTKPRPAANGSAAEVGLRGTRGIGREPHPPRRSRPMGRGAVVAEFPPTGPRTPAALREMAASGMRAELRFGPGMSEQRRSRGIRYIRKRAFAGLRGQWAIGAVGLLPPTCLGRPVQEADMRLPHIPGASGCAARLPHRHSRVPSRHTEHTDSLRYESAQTEEKRSQPRTSH